MGPPKSVLVIEDQADIAELLRFNLEREGYDAKAITDGAAAITEIRRNRPDLLVLDRMLPGISGDEILSQLRRDSRLASIPVIMLTAKAEESDALVGFALGADDYVTKPFSMKLLLARVAAIFRRIDSPDAEAQILSAGPVRLDVSRHELIVDGAAVPATATEFRLMRSLMAAGGRVLSRSQLIDSVLGTGVAVTDRTIDVHITALRKKLGDAAGWIQTIRGVGYTFRQPAG